MANFNSIKHEIDQNVNTNGQQAITGAILNETLKDMLDAVDTAKQDTLVAGDGITIDENNEISAHIGTGLEIDPEYGYITINPGDLVTGYDGIVADNGYLVIDPSVVATQSDLSGKQDTLTAGSNIQISAQNVISATDTTYSAGDGIDIDGNNEISIKAGTGLGFDANGYLINTGGGGGGQTLSAGDGIEIDQNDAINAKLGNGLRLDGSNNIEVDTSVVATQNDLQNFLPLGGGTLQTFVPGSEDTELTVMDGYNEDYVKIVAPDTPGETPHIEIYENGSGDTKFFYDHIERGSQVSIDLPSSSGTLALTSDIPSYSAGSGIDIDANNEISVEDRLHLKELQVRDDNIATQLQVRSPGNTNMRIVSLSAYDDNAGVPGEAVMSLQSSNQSFANPGDTYSVALESDGQIKLNYKDSNSQLQLATINWPQKSGTIALTSDIPAYAQYTAGNGIDITSGTISVDATDLDGNGLSVDANGALEVDTSVIQEKLVAGSGISISAQNVISATGVGTSLWTSGTGTDSLIGPDGGTSSGAGSISLNGGATASNSTSMAGGYRSSAIGWNSLAYGNQAAASTDATISLGDHTSSNIASGVALGHYTQTGNKQTGSVALGKYNYVDTGSTATQNTTFSIGNGTGNNSRSNALELTAGNKFYMTGVGSYTGSNSSSAVSVQDVINGKQDQLTAGSGISISGNVISATGGGGSGLWVSGSGTNSLMAPGTAADSGNTASGDGAINAATTYTHGGSTAYSSTSGDFAFNFGRANTVRADYAGAVGSFNDAADRSAFCIGEGSQATGIGSFAGGYVSGGYGSLAGGDGDFAFNGTTGTGSGGQNVAIVGEVKSTGSQNLALACGVVGGTGINPSNAVAIGQIDAGGVKSNARASMSIAIGGETNGERSVALGPGTKTNNEYEVAVGAFNKSYASSVDDSIRTSFSIGNGTALNGVVTRKSAVEVKKNDDIYVVGVGGYTGDNYSTSDTLQDVINGKQDQLTAGTGITISGNVISATGGGGGGTTYGAGDGINIDSNDDINVKVESGGALDFNASDELVVDYATLAGAIAGSGLQVDSNTGETLEVDYSQIPGNIVGAGLLDNGNGQLEVDEATLAADLANNFLPLTGGVLQEDPNNNVQTSLDVYSPDNNAWAYVYSYSTDTSDPNNPAPASSEVGIVGELPTVADQTYDTYYRSNGTVLIGYTTDNYGTTDSAEFAFPQKPSGQTYTLATLDDISGGGSYVAGNGIDITSGTISVDETYLDSVYLPIIGGTLENTANHTDLKIAAPHNESTAYTDIKVDGTTGTPYIELFSETSIGTDAESFKINGLGNFELGYVNGTSDIIELPHKAGTIALLSDISGGGGSYLPLEGGTIQGDPNDGDTTTVEIDNPSGQTSKIGLYAYEDLSDPQDPQGEARVYLIDPNGEVNIKTTGIDDSTYTCAWPTLTQDTTFATLDDIQSGGGLWTSGTGTDSVVAPGTVSAGLTGDAAGIGAVSCGYDSNANGDYSFACGGASSADGDYSFVANNGVAAGDYAAAFGTSGADGDYSFAAGYGSIAGAAYSIALAGGNVVYDDSDPNDVIDAQYGVAIGIGATVQGQYGVAIGQNAASEHDDAVAIGAGAQASGQNAFAVMGGTANSDNAFAIGGSANADYSVAFPGSQTDAQYSFAAGEDSLAQAYDSVALGGGVVVYDDSDPNNIINAEYGVAIGMGSTAETEYSLAMMGGTASAQNGGSHSVAIGDGATAEGYYDVALTGSSSRGNYSFAASTGIAEGHYSTGLSGGEGNGEGSIASGFGSVAFGYASAALGLNLMTYDQADGTDPTDSNAGEAAFGRYNYSEQDIIFSIGCGHYEPPVDPTDPSDVGTDVRENAITITNDGKIYLKGLGGYTGTSVSGCTDLVSFLNNL